MSGDESAAVLAAPMRPNDAGAATIRDYLVGLLRDLWRDPPAFNGKRPYGNSSWEYDLYEALADAGLIQLDRNEYDEIEEVDDEKGDALIAAAIETLR